MEKKVTIDEYFVTKGWNVVYTKRDDLKRGKYFTYENLSLSKYSRNFLRNFILKGIFQHQKESLEAFSEGKNVCLSTSTASGKSMVFYIGAIEKLVRYPKSKVMAIYPLKALCKEQEIRWKGAFSKAGLKVEVGRIDGGIPMHMRFKILKNSRVLLMTPDIAHAWLLYNLGNRNVINFLQNISLIVVDEVHNYTGVFGSNSAYLFRRLRHLMGMLDSFPQYIAASATIANPEVHLKNLIGVEFKIIGPELDTSPRHEIIIELVDPPGTKDLLSTVSKLMEFIALETNYKFITFVDSRKQTEYMASIASRSQIVEDEHSLDDDHLHKLSILPYRSGYEENDRNTIQERLANGTLTGIVSTSALELGIDIPFLTLGILVGVPHSATNFYQRIGRIGRRSAGKIIIINTGDIYSESIFRDPEQLLKMPFSEGTMYLKNPRIQYIHALCLARHGGEHDQVCSALNKESLSKFESSIVWPPGFMKLCDSERVGMIPTELQSIKEQAGDDPNHVYPLRDVDIQFQVKRKRGPVEESLGSLSYGQLMREAYPGAVYYYTTKSNRVYRVMIPSRIVKVRKEKKYTTKPLTLPIMVYPNLTPENIYASRKYGDLIVAECNLQIRESIKGFKEKRGPKEFSVEYPLDYSSGIYFPRSRFTRNYFTTGVILTHPKFNEPNVQCNIIANLIFEAFLMIIPIERNDIHFASDKHRVERENISSGDKFVAIYDQTYGSLRLSGRILENQILKRVLEKALVLAHHEHILDIKPETISAMEYVLSSSLEPPIEISFESEKISQMETERFKKVIMPGSKGLNIMKDNEEFFVKRVFYKPNGKLYYGGNYLSGKGEILIPINSLREIPGESKLGFYDLETGKVIKGETKDT